MQFGVWINVYMKGIRSRKLQIYGIQLSLAMSLNAWRHSQRQQPQILIDLRLFATSALLRKYVMPPKNTHTVSANEKRDFRCELRSVVYHQHSLSPKVHPVWNEHRCRSINLRNLHHRKSIKISSSGRILRNEQEFSSNKSIAHNWFYPVICSSSTVYDISHILYMW